MQVHELQPSYKNKKPQRVGRGGKRGTYSGRGCKGQKSRAGRKIKSQLKEQVLKFPKKRGAGFLVVNNKEIIEIKLPEILKVFPKGGEITPKKLAEKNLIRIHKNKKYVVKILGPASLNVPLTIKHCLATKRVEEAVLKAGGKLEQK